MSVSARIASLLDALNHPSLPGIELSLGRMEALLAALGNPEQRLPPVIHLAGTNGKGSTQAFLGAIYKAAGYRVHAYTSPHLVRFNERIVVAGEEISDDALLPLLERVYACVQQCPATFFEATTALAMLAFAEHPADVVLLEVGLGGRLDATNVIAQPMATIITPISFDHMEFLGDSLTRIAAEKAGIIKPQVPCISGAQVAEVQALLSMTAQQRQAPFWGHGEGWRFLANAEGITVTCGQATWDLPLPSLQGEHQAHNAALASVVVRICHTLPVQDAAMAEGIAQARWPGRLQLLTRGPLVETWGARGAVVLDGAHNVAGAEALASWLAAQKQPVTLVCGMMQRKDAAAFLKPLASCISHFIAVPIAGEACYSPEALTSIAASVGMLRVSAGQLDRLAFEQQEPGILLITGSLFLAGEVLRRHG